MGSSVVLIEGIPGSEEAVLAHAPLVPSPAVGARR